MIHTSNLNNSCNKKLVLIVGFLMALLIQIGAKNYYVSKAGSDRNTGTEASPYLTISRATKLLRAGDTCFVKEGIYRETVQFSYSGSSSKRIVLTNFENDSVLVSATETLSNWEPHSGSIYKAKVDMSLGTKNMVYSNNKAMDWARWPNNTDNDVYTIQCDSVLSGTASSLKSANGIPNLNWAGGYIWYLGAHCGMSWTRPIISQSGNEVVYEAVDITKWPFNPHNPTVYRHNNRGRYFLFGVYDALDYEREWYYDASVDTLYFQAPGNVNPSTLKVETAKRTYTLKLNKNYVVVDGIHAFGGKIELDGDYTSIRNGNYLNCLQTLDDLNNTSAQVGSGAIEVKGNNVIIEYNTINGSTLNGIYIQGWGGVDKATIKHNYILNCNSVGNHSSPIRANSSNHTIISNTIKTTGRDGIYCSGFNNEIAYNDISYCMMINNDGGVFYTVGNANQKNMKIHHNWMHDSFGPWYADGRAAGIYLDNNSKGFDVHHNVVWNISWTGLQVNWNNNNIDFFNNTLMNCSEATGRWANGYVENDNRVWNNYSTVGEWRTTDFKPEVKTNIIATSGLEDEANYNFIPLANSDLVDKATIVSGITDNAVGTAPDIGAYERGITPWIPGVNTQYGGVAENGIKGFLRISDAYEVIDSTLSHLDTTTHKYSKTIHHLDSVKSQVQALDTIVNSFVRYDTTFIDSTFLDSTFISVLHLDSIFDVQFDSLVIRTKESISTSSIIDSIFATKVVMDTISFHSTLDFDTLFEVRSQAQFEKVEMEEKTDTIANSFTKNDTIVFTLITNTLEQIELSVYPNPTQGMLTIELNQNKVNALHVDIYSIAGHLVYSDRLTSKRINVSHLKNGTYILKINGYQNAMFFKR